MDQGVSYNRRPAVVNTEIQGLEHENPTSYSLKNVINTIPKQEFYHLSLLVMVEEEETRQNILNYQATASWEICAVISTYNHFENWTVRRP